MRFRDLLKDIHKVEQKLENVLLYVDSWITPCRSSCLRMALC